MVRIIHQIRNSYTIRGFLINSVPKSGTHLLCKAIQSFPGISKKHIHIGRSSSDDCQRLHSADTDDEKLAIGIDAPSYISVHSFRKALSNIASRKLIYATCHLPFERVTDNLIQELGLNSLLILRDPRDVCVSHAKFISKNSNHFLHDLYRTMPRQEQIMISIRGMHKDNLFQLSSITDRFRSVEGWMGKDYNYTTYFERLVGEQGGGSKGLQYRELRNIAEHLGLKYQEADLLRITSKLFGGTITFNKGLIGSWKEDFDLEHKRIFKDIAGHLLIDLGYEKDFDW